METSKQTWYNQRTGKFLTAQSWKCRLGLYRRSKTPFLRVGQLNGVLDRVNIDAREICTECSMDLGPAWALFNVPLETNLDSFNAPCHVPGTCLCTNQNGLPSLQAG